MQTKTAAELVSGERVFLDPGMEFTVQSITHHGFHDKVYDRWIESIEIHLDDGIEGFNADDTGSMSIVRDPQDQVRVLAPEEDAPQVNWEGPKY